MADCSDGKMTVHNENIMKFNVCKAFPNAEGVEWEKDCKLMWRGLTDTDEGSSHVFFLVWNKIEYFHNNYLHLFTRRAYIAKVVFSRALLKYDTSYCMHDVLKDLKK